MKDLLKIIGWTVMALLVCVAIGGCKYHLWRAEHPGAATWTFFIPK